MARYSLRSRDKLPESLQKKIDEALEREDHQKKGKDTKKQGKIRNARKVDEYGRPIFGITEWKKKFPDGLYFDSVLEWRCWNFLKKNNIRFELKRTYTILPEFTFQGETVRPTTWTPDFYLTDHDMIWETKGFANDGFGNKLKLMKHHLVSQGQNTRIEILSSIQEIQEAYKRLIP